MLIAEDDRVIANAMATHLRRAGMEVEVAEDGDRALRKLRFERPDLAVVDLMLPGVDGWMITETLRAEGIETPIVIVSARGSEHDKVHALSIGGDDYLAKPFGMRELVARVEAVLRRAGMTPVTGRGRRIEADGLVIDPDLHAAMLGGAGLRADADGVPAVVRAGVGAGESAQPRPAAAAGVGDAPPPP